MERHEIGKFYAISFDGDVIEFIVFDNNTMDSPTLDIYNFKRIELKPRFVLWDDSKYYRYNVPSTHHGVNPKLIRKYDIDGYLFEYLKQNGMIMYSNDMALLYDFPDKEGFDSKTRKGHQYKWTKHILEKQREGIFN